MSILNFSDILLGLSIGSSGSDESLGSFANSAVERQIQHIQVLMYFNGAYGGEKLTLSLTDSLGSPTVTYTSDVINVLDIDPLLNTGTDWFGWVRFDFNKEWISASATYFVYISSTLYTETRAHSINLVFDWPRPIYGTKKANARLHPIGMQIYCIEEG